MPLKVESPMSLRQEFVMFALRPDANISSLCRRFDISRKTGYKWLARSRTDPTGALLDASRRPIYSPGKTSAAIELLVTGLRGEHPAWGARKIKRRLEDLGCGRLRAAAAACLGRGRLFGQRGRPVVSAAQAGRLGRLVVCRFLLGQRGRPVVFRRAGGRLFRSFRVLDVVVFVVAHFGVRAISWSESAGVARVLRTRRAKRPLKVP